MKSLFLRMFPAWVLLLLIGSALAQALHGGPLMRYEQHAIIEQHEWWRMLSGHLIHLGWKHYLMNAIGLMMINGLYGNAYRSTYWLLMTLCISLGISAAFLSLIPQLNWYVGLSGTLHGLLVLGILSHWKEQRHDADLLLLALITGKLIWEQLAGSLPGSESIAGGHVLVEAHLFGFVFGCLLSLVKPR